VNFATCGDNYAKLLLADVLSAAPSHKASGTQSRRIAVDAQTKGAIVAWMPHRAIDQPQMQG
jgi:hypothetical protein